MSEQKGENNAETENSPSGSSDTAKSDNAEKKADKIKEWKKKDLKFKKEIRKYALQMKGKPTDEVSIDRGRRLRKTM